jgi:Na+-driven multidrug efflux pump
VFKTGIIGAWIALVADQLFRSIFVLLRYYSGKWKRIRI